MNWGVMSKLTKNQRIFIIITLAAFIFVVIFYLTDMPPDSTVRLIPIEELPLNLHLFDSIPKKLINISFRYILNNNICNTTEEIVAIFIVTSYFGNIETRSSMRRAFNSEDLEKLKLRRVFLLGEAPKDKYTTQQSVNDENNRFGDIIQGNFSEAYRNLTYKHVMGLKWAGTYCRNAQYVIKMDDDTVVNMYKLKEILNSLDPVRNKSFIAGYKLNKMKPIREPANKWFVTENEYSLNNYPIFVSGWFYVTNPESAVKLATLANYEKYFWIDDVFVTGILASKLKMMLFDISKYFAVNSEFLQCCLQDFEKSIDCDIYVGPNGGDPNMFVNFNKKVKKCSVSNECTKRLKPLNETCVAERKINLGKGDPVISNFKLI